MADFLSTDVSAQWRADVPTPKIADAPHPHRRGPQIFVALALTLGLLGAIGGVLSWLGPVPNPYFLPIIVTEYQAREIPFLPMAEADLEGLQQANLFPRASAQTLNCQEGHLILQALRNLENQAGHDTAIVYLAAHALLGAEGEVLILPGDANADNPRTWIALRDVLAHLQACPARRKLLVLDIMKPFTNPRLSAIYQNIAGAVARELDNTPDSGRLVLTACSSGQESIVSEELGRSVFSYYFEEGLRGYAEGYGPDGRRNGQISVRELAAFLRARVDRWAQRHRGDRQTPLLHGDGDFPLVALDHNQSMGHIPRPPSPKYPDFLLAAWKQRDQNWQNDAFLLQPRIFQKEEAILLEMEKDWRGGVSLERIRKNHLAFWQRLEKSRVDQMALIHPRAVSLAQEAYLRHKPNPAAFKDLDALMTQSAKAVGNPEEIVKTRAKLLAEFRLKTKDLTEFDLESAVTTWALRESVGDPATLRFLDDLVRRPGQPGPRYAETLTLRQLVDLNDRLPAKEWTNDGAARLLRWTAQAEAVEGDPTTAVWFGPLLDQAVEARHAAIIRILAPGFTSENDKSRVTRLAIDQYQFLSEVGGVLRQAQQTAGRALALLPFGPAYLEDEPDQQKNWTQVAQLTKALTLALRSFPGETPPTAEKWKARLSEELAQVRRLQQRLQEAMREHAHPFEEVNLQRVVQLSRLPSAGPAQLHALDALLAGPMPLILAESRVALWKARHELASRLVEATLLLDADDDDHERHTAASGIPDGDEAIRVEQEMSWRRVDWSLLLADVGGIRADRLEPVRQALRAAKSQPSNLEKWGKLGSLTRALWTRVLVEQFQEDKRLAARLILTCLAPPLDSIAGMDDGEMRVATQLRLLKYRALWTRLGEQYRYLARDFTGLGLDSPGLRDTWSFYLQAATANQDLARPGPEAYVTLAPTRPIEQLGPARTSTNANLEVRRFLPAGGFGPVDIVLHRPDDVWLQATPDSATLPAVKKSAEPRLLSHTMPVRIMLKDGALASPTPKPAGLLAAARFQGRTYHALIAVPLPGTTQDVQILLSANPKEPTPALTEIRLRPGNIRQGYFLYLRNALDVERKVNVEWLVGDIPFAGAKLSTTLPAKGTQKIVMPEAPPPKGPPGAATPASPDALPELTAPLQVRVTDAVTNRVLETRTIPVDVASPREYVQIRGIQFSPGVAPEGKNKLSAQVQTIATVDGPPIATRLVLLLDRIPGLKSVGGGTLQVDLPPQSGEPAMTLFAEDLKFAEGFPEEGPVYIDVDGVPRAFVFTATFARRGDPTTPRSDGRPALLIPTPPFAPSNPAFFFPVEVDNAPTGATLEVSVCRAEGTRLTADLTRRFPSARQRRIGFWPLGPGGAVLLEGSIQDRLVHIDTTLIQGRRVLRGRLFDEGGALILETRKPIVFDATAPTAVRFLDPSTRAKRGAPLKFTAQGFDAESGISGAVFFLGKPQDDTMPKDAVPLVGSPTDDTRTTWTVTLPMPEDKKPSIPVSVLFTNNVGLKKAAVIEIQLLDTDPAKTGPTRIKGKVTEGGRPQPGLEVLLLDQKGKEKARTKSQADGSYQFNDVVPGKYQVYSLKPDSLRRALIAVEIGPAETKTVDLPLAL